MNWRDRETKKNTSCVIDLVFVWSVCHIHQALSNNAVTSHKSSWQIYVVSHKSPKRIALHAIPVFSQIDYATCASAGELL